MINMSEVFSKSNDGKIQQNGLIMSTDEVVDYLNISNNAIDSLQYENAQLRKENEQLKDENERLRLELETHKHPLWSTREAEKKVNELSDSLADEVKRNGLLNEELNQLRIENMRLKKIKQNLEVLVEQCNETLKRLKEEYDE